MDEDELQIDDERDADDAATGAARGLQLAQGQRGESYDGSYGSEQSDAAQSGRTWRQEVPRWLAALNPGRTTREYEKAISYFFLTPGVPQTLDDISFDLLLAYRGALALRAMPHEQGRTQGRSRWPAGPALAPGERRYVSGVATARGEADETDTPSTAPPQVGPLAPATVNIRLTALRQFLVHCANCGLLPDLTPDRIRSALRRLKVERRRPYQVLAEGEWREFLAAARLPARPTTDTPATLAEGTIAPRTTERSGPWGTPRAARQQRQQERREVVGAPESGTAAEEPTSHVVRSRSGLTGARTAERDHALLALALATGLRSIELASLDVGDLSRERHDGREEWWLVLPDAKTKGQHGGRILPLAPELVETLLDYVRSTGRRWERAEDRRTPLFLSSRGAARQGSADTGAPAPIAGGRLHPAHIRAIVDRVETQWLAMRASEDADGHTAGETRSISPHALRHSTAVALLEGNDQTGRPPASVEHVRGWLGHFDIRTTQGYLAHLESRRHRRPFTLTPATQPPARAEGGAEPEDTTQL